MTDIVLSKNHNDEHDRLEQHQPITVVSFKSVSSSSSSTNNHPNMTAIPSTLLTVPSLSKMKNHQAHHNRAVRIPPCPPAPCSNNKKKADSNIEDILSEAEDLLKEVLITSSTHHSLATASSVFTYQEDDTWDDFCEDLPLQE